MNEKSTQVQSGEKFDETEAPAIGASSKTINLLKMFARSYHVETSLPIALNAISVN